MEITGQILPASRQIISESQTQQQPDSRRERQIAQYKHQPPVEYLFRGEFDDGFDGSAQQRVPNFEQINPANRSAIFSYHDTASASIEQPQRKGRMLDIFL